MKLVSSLEEELKQAEQRLTVLRQNADGTEDEIPLEDA